MRIQKISPGLLTFPTGYTVYQERISALSVQKIGEVCGKSTQPSRLQLENQTWNALLHYIPFVMLTGTHYIKRTKSHRLVKAY